MKSRAFNLLKSVAAVILLQLCWSQTTRAESVVATTTDTPKLASSAAQTGWQLLNTWPQSISSVVISPNFATDRTLFVGTYFDIFRSTNAGSTWITVTNNIGLEGAYLAISPNYASDHTLFVGTDYGIYRSTNSGDSWTNLNGPGTYLAISPNYANDDTVFAGTDGVGIYRSIDGGATWVPANSGLQIANSFFPTLSPNFSSDHTLFAIASASAGALSGVVYRSTNSGAGWSAIKTFSGHALGYPELSPDYANDQTLFVGTTDQVYRSADGGNTWTAVGTGLINPSLPQNLTISPNYSTDHTLFIAKPDGVYRSNDGGNTWTIVGSLIAQGLAISPSYSSDHTLFAVSNGHSLYVMQTPAVEPTLSISHIEITQAIQDTANAVPLIAGKPTFVRVYVDCGAGCTSLPNVSGTLDLSGPAGSTTLSRGPITAYHPADWTSQRGNLAQTLNFVVPSNLVAGTVTLIATVNGITRPGESFTFYPGQKLRIAWTLVGYDTGSVLAYASGDVVDKGDSFLRKIYPVGVNDVDYFYQPGFKEVIKSQFTCTSLFSCPAVTEYLKALNRFWDRISREGGWQGGQPPDRLFGWVPREARVSQGICGIADARWGPSVPLLLPRGKGRVAAGADFCDKLGGIILPPSHVFAHEIGHLLNDQGLHHAPNRSHLDDSHCFAVPGDPDTHYPNYVGYPQGSIGEFGLDALSNALLPPSTTYDFMSYCNPNWISPYNYSNLFSGFTPVTDAFSQRVLASTATRQLLVSGTVYSPSLTVKFDPFYAISSTVAADTNAGGDFCLELRGNSGLLDNRCFELGFTDPESDTPTGEDAFALAVPYPISTTQVSLTHLGNPIGSVAVSSNAPTVTLTYPNGGEVWSGTGTYTVTWTANDLDGGPLYYALDYSTDAGTSWTPIGVDITTTHIVINLSDLPGGSSILLRVSASDGANTAYDVSDAPLSVGLKGPQAFILSPEGDETIPANSQIFLQGYGYSLQDGTLGDSALRWSSNKDGNLRTGNTVLAYLSPGQHVITLTATDSHGFTATDTVNVFVGFRIFMPSIQRGP